MKSILVLLGLALASSSSAAVSPSPSLGKAAAACAANESGPALMLAVDGLKDRKGLLRVELYPATDADFLAPDFKLVNAGKTFGRVDIEPIPAGVVNICVKVPKPGRYAISVLHDRDRNLKLGIWGDGAGFPGGQKLGRSKPTLAMGTVNAGAGLTKIGIRMQYLRGFGFSPLPTK